MSAHHPNIPHVKAASPSSPNADDEIGTIVKGSSHDISRGPVKRRGCTDVLWLSLFLCATVFFVYVSVDGLKNGNGLKLIYQRDWAGRACGAENDVAYRVHNLTNFDNVVLMANVTALYGDQAIMLACKHKTNFKDAGCMENDDNCKENIDAVCMASASSKTNANQLVDILANPTKRIDDVLVHITSAVERVITGGDKMDISKFSQKTCVKSCDAYNYFVTHSHSSATVWDKKFGLDFPIAAAWNKFVGSNSDSDLRTAYNEWTQKINDKIKVMNPTVCPYDSSNCVYIHSMTKKFNRECLAVKNERTEISWQNLIMGAKQTFYQFKGSDIGQAVGMVEETWYFFPAVAGIAVLIGLIFLIFLRLSVWFTVWLCILLTFLALLAGGTIFLWFFAGCKINGPDGLSVSVDPACTNGEHVISKEYMRNISLALSVVCYVLTAAYVCFIACLFKAIKLSIRLSKVAARFVVSNPLTILIPFAQIICIVIFLGGFIFLQAYVLTASDAADPLNNGIYDYATAEGTSKIAGKCTSSWPERTVGKDVDASECKCPPGVCEPAALQCWRCGPAVVNVGWQFWFVLGYYLWADAMVFAIGQMILAGAVGTWYFNQDRLGRVFPITRGIKNTFIYHLGTIAFGSFILAMVRLVKWWLTYLKKQADASKNGVLAKVATALICCVKCFERCIEFINTFAYIRCALTGENFCSAAYHSFKVNTRNLRYVGVLTSVATLINRIGQFLIACLSPLAGFYLRSQNREDLDIAINIGIDFVLGFAIGKTIMSTFRISCLSILTCFLNDKEMGNGMAKNVPIELKSFYKEIGENERE